ncbi:unnamed protein product, partial [Iphiclides podalirius]
MHDALGFVFCNSRHGNTVLCYGNYRYRKGYVYSDGERIKWECVKVGRSRGSCGAAVVTLDGTVVDVKSIHNH